MNLSSIEYFPALRAGKFDLLALLELENERKQRISPIISARGNAKQLEQFAERWGDFPFWVDSSRFPQDASDELASTLNKGEGNFAEKQNLLATLSGINKNVLPIVGFRASDNARQVVQFALYALKNFSFVAIRVEMSGKALDQNLSLTSAILNAVDDDDINRIYLIADMGSINSVPDTDESSDIARVIGLAAEYSIDKIVTLSTSWPDDRPDKGTIEYRGCLDPIWQAQVFSAEEADFNLFYGDYAATNPVKDLLDNFDPKKMAAPVPFAGYLTPCIWVQSKQGRSGENEQFKTIANQFRNLENYHGDNFCWGTRQIGAIATGARAPGNMAFWNKIRVNQHICAMLHAFDEGMFDWLLTPDTDNDADLEDDLI